MLAYLLPLNCFACAVVVAESESIDSIFLRTVKQMMAHATTNIAVSLSFSTIVCVYLQSSSFLNGRQGVLWQTSIACSFIKRSEHSPSTLRKHCGDVSQHSTHSATEKIFVSRTKSFR